MPDIAVNQAYTVAARFEDDSGPITGQTVTATVTLRSSGATIHGPVTATEVVASSGVYQFTAPASAAQAGRVRVVFSSASGLYHETFLSIGIIQPWMQTRRDIRARLVRLMDGHEAHIRTRFSAGSTNQAVFADVPMGGRNEYAGRWLRFSAGANRGLDRKVTAYEPTTSAIVPTPQTFTWAPNLPATPASGELVELLPHAGVVYDEAIDQAIASLAPRFLQPAEERLFATDGATTEWQLPSDWRFISRVGVYRVADGKFARHFGAEEWQLRPGGKLFVAGKWLPQFNPFNWPITTIAAIPAGYLLGVEGYAYPGHPAWDSSYVDIQPDAVVAQAHAIMARQRPERWSSLLVYLDRAAQAEANRHATSLAADAVEVI